MKKIFGMVIALVCLLGAVNVHAVELVRPVESVRIWQKSSGEKFPAFHTAMKQRGWADDTTVSTKGLGEAAFAMASKNNFLALVSKSNRGRTSYIKMFQRWNGLPEDNISIEQFRVRGQNIGFWLPSTKELVTPESNLASLVLVQGELKKLGEEFKQVSAKVDVSQDSITSLKLSLNELESKVGPLSLETAGIKGTINEFRQGLQAVEDGEFTEAMSAAIDMRVKSQIEDIGERVSLIGWLLLIGAVLTLLLGIYLIQLGKKQDIKTKAHEEILKGDGTDDKPGLVKEVAELKEVVNHPKTGLAAVRDDVETVKKITVADITWNQSNPSLEQLADLSGGRNDFVVWAFRRGRKAYRVKLWREDTTPEGQVCTNIVRNVQSDTLADPIAIKRLKLKIAEAVTTGRISPVKPKASAATK